MMMPAGRSLLPIFRNPPPGGLLERLIQTYDSFEECSPTVAQPLAALVTGAPAVAWQVAPISIKTQVS